MKWIKTYEDYTDEETLYYHRIGEKIKEVYIPLFNKFFSVFGIDGHRINIKINDVDKITFSIFSLIENKDKAVRIRSKSVERITSNVNYDCIVPIFLYYDSDDARLVNIKGGTNVDSTIRIIFSKKHYSSVPTHTKGASNEMIYTCKDKIKDEDNFKTILTTFKNHLTYNISDKILFSNATDSLAKMKTVEFPTLRNVLIKYCDLLLSKTDLGTMEIPINEIYEMIYYGIINLSIASRLMAEIKIHKPNMYNYFLKIGKPEEIIKSEEMGRMGFGD
jgi:hypothetical protein